MKSIRTLAAAGAVTLALGSAGCASTQEPRSPFDRTGTNDQVLLTVENQDFRDATVYVYWNGVKDRAGFVTGKTTRTFEMTWKSEDVVLEVDFVGQGGFYSERVPVYQGDHLNFVIMPEADRYRY
ncbi:MAG TPA: hypothetical protein VLA09_06235 [Longimicrobiales bacterium]|nr:hypothetical protein [Longimicrobiales bacterium]